MLEDLVSAEILFIIKSPAHIKYSSKQKLIYINMFEDLVSAEI
jgi:hypothetical protein